MTFAAGQTMATVEIPITDDTAVENAEMFSATVSPSTIPSDVMIGEGVASITILDEDGKAFCKAIQFYDFIFLSPAPEPVFEQTVYTVPENNRTVPLCIDVGVELQGPMEFIITSKSKDPPDAQGQWVTVC